MAMSNSDFYSAVGQYINKDVDLATWNETWDYNLEGVYRPRPEYRRDLFPPSMEPLILSQAFLSSLDELQRALCKMQFSLAQWMIDTKPFDNFATRWLRFSPKEREAHILTGLVIVCTNHHEDRRMSCPETTMKFLQEDGGRGFLNLIATICPDDGNEPSLREEPIFILHPEYNKLRHIDEPTLPDESEVVRAAVLRSFILERNHFLTCFLWSTVQHIYGRYRKVIGSRWTGDRESLRKMEAMPIPNRDWKAIKNESKEIRRASQWHCVNCGKPEEALPDGRKFLACAKCIAIKKKTKYCDRECQKNDWTNGKPPHKVVCGKLSNVPGASVAIPVRVASVDPINKVHDGQPPPDPGYVHSPALTRQISLLNGNTDPEVAYFFTGSNGGRDHPVMLGSPMANMLFQVVKSMAMKTGESRAVVSMYDALLTHASKVEVSEARLLAQLSEEYGVTVDEISLAHRVCDLGEEKAIDTSLKTLELA